MPAPSRYRRPGVRRPGDGDAGEHRPARPARRRRDRAGRPGARSSRSCVRWIGSSAPTGRTRSSRAWTEVRSALDDCPEEVLEVLALGEQARVESDGAFDVHRPGRRSAPARPERRGQGVGRATSQPAPRAAARHGLLPVGRGRHGLRGRRPRPTRLAHRVEDPHQPSRLVARVPVRHGAVATSSAAHRGEHITDARTGRPATGVASVTVVAADLTWADIDATAAFALGDRAVPWLRTREGRTALVVSSDGNRSSANAPAPTRGPPDGACRQAAKVPARG